MHVSQVRGVDPNSHRFNRISPFFVPLAGTGAVPPRRPEKAPRSPATRTNKYHIRADCGRARGTAKRVPEGTVHRRCEEFNDEYE